MRRIVIGITGASGSLYGYMVLQALRSIGGVETHLVLTSAARRTIDLETEMTADDFEALADVAHRDDDLAAAISVSRSIVRRAADVKTRCVSTPPIERNACSTM